MNLNGSYHCMYIPNLTTLHLNRPLVLNLNKQKNVTCRIHTKYYLHYTLYEHNGFVSSAMYKFHW